MPPLFCRIDLDPGIREIGRTKVDWTRHDPTPENLKKVLVSVMLGRLADGQREVHDWPIRPDDWQDNPKDASQIEYLCGELGFDEIDFRQCLYRACKRRNDPVFKRLVRGVRGRLLDIELVLRPELIVIAEGII